VTDEGVLAWRLVRPRFAAREAAFSGEGARRFGGRWNSPGRGVVYASATLSLAALETLAHAERSSVDRDWVAFALSVPAGRILGLRSEDLPADWRGRPTSSGARAVGDAWLAQAASAALLVPSVLVPQERNVLLNPVHPEFGDVTIGPATPFRFDARLFDPRRFDARP